MNIYSRKKEQKCDYQSHLTHSHHDERKQKRKKQYDYKSHCKHMHLMASEKEERKEKKSMTQ